jgi:hypothetical protein
VDETLRLPVDLQPVRVVEAVRDLLGDVRSEAGLERLAPGPAALHQGREIGALDQLHAKVEPPLVLAKVVDVDDVAMLEERGDLALLHELGLEHGARGQILADNLQRDVPLEAARPRSLGAVQLAHPARSKTFDHPIFPDPLIQECTAPKP